MLSLPPVCRIWLVADPCDMRKGFDGLLAEAKRRRPEDALSGHLFVFLGRNRRQVKVLWWSAGGLSMHCKRLEQGTFRVPQRVPGQSTVAVSAADLAMLLDGIDWTRARRQTLYQPQRSLAQGGSTSAPK